LGKPFKGLDYLIKEILRVYGPDTILDGELYCHGGTFQNLVSVVKSGKGSETVQFIIYDYVADIDYCDRYAFLASKFAPSLHLKLIQTDTCATSDNVGTFLDAYVSDGYEGLIVRNKVGPYVCKFRSKNLLKLKNFIDDEFKIICYTDGAGKEFNHIIFVCETKDGRGKFNVRPKGTSRERVEMFREGEKYVGQFLTVRYQELTLSGIPRFPVGISIRNYE